MSYFILYFELNGNDKSQHNNRDAINNYSIDKEISEGKICVKYKKFEITAAIIASRMDASLFYVFAKPVRFIEIAQRIRTKLYKFLKDRICLNIESYFFVLDLSGAWPDKVNIPDAFIDVPFFRIDEFFKSGVKLGLFRIIK